jgi:hypothetical protein
MSIAKVIGTFPSQSGRATGGFSDQTSVRSCAKVGRSFFGGLCALSLDYSEAEVFQQTFVRLSSDSVSK